MKKWLKIIIISLLLVTICTVLVAGWLVGTRSGGQFLVNTALPYATPYFPENMRLHTEGIVVDTLADIRIAKLTLSDMDGTWLEVQDLHLAWSPFSLVSSAFIAETLSAEKLVFSRPPLTLEEPQNITVQEQIAEILKTFKEAPQTVATLKLPPIRITTLSIPHLEVHSGIDMLPTVFILKGEVEMATAPFNAEVRLESKEGVFTTASLGASGTPEDLRVIVQWREQEGGILAEMLQFAKPTFSHITIAAQLAGKKTSLEGAIDAGERPFMSLKGSNGSFDIEFPAPEISGYFAGFSAPLLLKGNVSNDGETAILSLNASTAAFSPAEGASLADVALTLSASIRDSATPFSFDAGLNALLSSGESIQKLPVSFVLKGAGNDAEWTIETLRAKAAASALEAKGEFDIADGKAALEGNILAALPLEADAPPTQEIKAAFKAQATALWETPQANATLELQALQADLPDEIRQILELPLTITAEMLGSEAAFTIAGKHLNGEGKFMPAAENAEELVTAALRVSPIATEAFTIPDTIHIKARYRANGSGNAAVTTSGLNLTSGYALGESEINFSPITLSGGDAISLKGDVKLNTESSLATGKLGGFIRSLEPLSKLGISVPTFTAEKGDVSLNLSAKDKAQHVTASFDVGKFSLDSLAAGGLKTKAEVVIPPKGAIKLDAKLDVADVDAPVAVDAITVTAKGNIDALTITANAKKIAEVYDLQAKADVSLGEAIKIALNAFELAWDKHLLALTAPTVFEMKGDDIRLAKTELRLDGKTPILAEATLGKETVFASLTASALPFSALPVTALHDTSGTLDIALNVNGAAANPVAEFSVSANDLNQNYPHAAKDFRTNPVDAKLNGRIADDRLSATLNGSAEGGESKLDGAVNMPFILSLLPGKYAVSPGDSLDATLKADVILAPFLPLLLPDGIYGNGHLIVDLTAKGALDDPETNGMVDLHSGHIEVLATGTVLKDITLKANAKNDRLTLTEGSATDGDKGRMTFNGFAELTPNMPVDFTIALRDANLMRHQNANATLSGDLSLKGDKAASLFSGELDIQRARFSVAGDGAQSSIPEIPVREVASLDAPIISDAPEAEDPLGKGIPQTNFSDNLALKLRIKAANQIFIEGFGLDAELKTHIMVTGTANTPIIGGKLETLRGRWEFVGRSFTITRGEATLRREFITSPLLDIEAQAQAGDVTAIATIRGSATEPVITFSSIPSLPQDEILSRVMFGKNLNSISPFQALELAQMLRSLKGKGGGIGIFSKLKDTIGIDDLTIGGSGENGADMTVGVGKHLTDNAYLGVEGGAGENSGKVSLEVDLTPNISIETEARQNAETAARINYKYDY